MISDDDTRLYKSLGSLIKDYRQWHKMSQERLAESIGVSACELRNWETDRNRVRVDNLHDLSEMTGIPMQAIAALNIDQPVRYSIRKRRLAYSSIEGELHSFPEYWKHFGKPEDEYLIKNEPITKDKHIIMILSCHHEIFNNKRLLGRDVIKKAVMILPDLNRIIFDCWGHYVGHQVCLPISKDAYEQIKKQKDFEGYLTAERVSDILAPHEGVFFFYSSFAANVSVGYLLNINAVQYLNKMDKMGKMERKERKRYLFATNTATKEGREFLKNLGMRVVREYEHLRDEDSPKIFEITLNDLMKPFGPFGILRWMLKNNNRVGVEGQIREAKGEGVSAIQAQEPNNASHLHKKHLIRKISNCDPLIGGKIINQVCLNSKCTLYSKIGKGNIASNGFRRTKWGTQSQRFLCRECGKSFCSRARSIFYDLRSPEEKVLKAIKLLVKGMSLRSVAKTLEAKLDTVRHWLKVAAQQSGKIDGMLMRELKVSQVELDALWTFVKSNSLRKRATLWRKLNMSHGTDLRK